MQFPNQLRQDRTLQTGVSQASTGIRDSASTTTPPPAAATATTAATTTAAAAATTTAATTNPCVHFVDTSLVV